LKKIINEDQIPNKTSLKIYCIYNAKGSILGEITYLWKKLFLNFDCSLCNVSHNTFTEKQLWKKEMSKFKYKLEMLHLDEQPKNLQMFTEGLTPCVVSNNESEFNLIMDRDQINKLNGSVQLFFKKLNTKLLEI
jgi:hypothetical protein